MAPAARRRSRKSNHLARLCYMDNCQEYVDPTPPKGWDPELCKHHALAARLKGSGVSLPYHDPHKTVDAEPYSRWVLAVMEAKTVVFNGVTVPYINQRTLAMLTGCTQTTLSHLQHGDRPRIKPGTARKLDPWVLKVEPGPSRTTRVSVGGGLVRDAVVGERMPYAAVMVDRKGTAWQRTATGWDSVRECTVTSPSYPCRLVWLAPGTSVAPAQE